MKSIFTTPKVLKPKDESADWLVWFRYDGKLFRYKKGINYYKDLKERQKEADALKEALHIKLKQNWNPNIPDQDDEGSSFDLTFTEALQFALEKKKPRLAHKSYLGYSGTLRFAISAIETLKFRNIPIIDVKRVHIKTIMEKMQMQRSWSSKAYNKHLNHLKAILTELIEWNILESNPAHKIKVLPVDETIANRPATVEEQIKIKLFLKQKAPDFYVFISCIYHTGIRPEELLQIKNHMVDLKKNQIILPPHITKTNKERIVPINQHLLLDMRPLQLHIHPKDYFIFGNYRTPGVGNREKVPDFVPGPTKTKRDTATRRWNRLIKNPTGLNIDINMYAMKHTGANAKINAGMPLDVLRELYGHSSKMMTEKYATSIKEDYRQQILNNSPAF